MWKAYDRRQRKPVAVKVLHTQYARDASRRQRFFRGAREMFELRHPGIVSVIEKDGRDGRFHFFVMELVDDGDLHRAIRALRFPDISDRLRLVAEVGDALAYAHEQGVIHRDVKPGKAADSSAGTRTGSMLGTWAYAAPELMMGAKKAGAAADVYGLGMTGVFAIHGRDLPPTVLRDAPGFVAGLEAGEAVKEVLARAVAWEAEERFETMEAFCRALRESLKAPVRRPHHVELSLDGPFRWIETPLDGRVELWREIPAGSFMMGSPGGVGHDDERPRHRVSITAPFKMGVVPVTNAQFRAFDPEYEPHAWQGVPEEEVADHPAVRVNWRRAMDFCRWLSETFPWASGARLPTEEEWEYACRAGTETRYWKGDSESDLEQIGWYRENSGARAAYRSRRNPGFGYRDLGFRVLLPAGPAARAD